VKYLVLLGRFFYSAIFIGSGTGHFTNAAVEYARLEGVPMAGFLVPFSGVIALLGGISILLGYKARLGAWLIVIFLVPVTFMMHQFWVATEDNVAFIQQAMFMKNLALLGAALLITYFGSGPMSLIPSKKR
jgi:putative oxidoreductase